MNQDINQNIDDLKRKIITLEWDIAHIHNNRLLQIKKRRLEECKEGLAVLANKENVGILDKEKSIIAG